MLLVNDDLLLDFGPDLVAASQRYALRLSGLRTLLITHAHSDHFYHYNIEYRLEGFTVGARPCRLKIFAPAEVIQTIQTQYPDLEAAQIALHTVQPFTTWEADHYRLTCYQACHAEGKHQAQFYSVDDGRHRLLYATDTGPFPEATWAALAGQSFDVIVLEETGGDGTLPGHMNLTCFLDHYRRFQKEGMLRPGGRVIATHIAHEANPVHDRLVGRLEPQGVTVAYDGMGLEL